MNRIIGIILVGIIFLQSCAEQRPLSGGPKDSLPPIIDPSRASQNLILDANEDSGNE